MTCVASHFLCRFFVTMSITIMKIIIGSVSTDKISFIKKALAPKDGDLLLPMKVESSVANQPFGEDVILSGAKNRARNAANAYGNDGFDLAIGLEGGLVKEVNLYHLMCAVVIVNNTGKEFIGTSLKRPLPQEVSDAIIAGKEFGVVIREYAADHAEDDVTELVTREKSFIEALNEAYCKSISKYCIESSFNNRSGQTLRVVYHDIDKEDEVIGKKIRCVHGFCFYKDKLVLVYSIKKGYWTPPGGSVESGETVEQAVIRETKEESNMKVLKHHILGYQDIYEPDKINTQTRSVCIVEPYGPFVSDPDGDIDYIKLIDPQDLKKYLDWDKVGDHLLERALKLKEELLKP